MKLVKWKSWDFKQGFAPTLTAFLSGYSRILNITRNMYTI